MPSSTQLHNPSSIIEKYLPIVPFPTLYQPGNLQSKLTHPSALVPLLSLAITVAYLFVAGHLSRTHNIHLSPFQFAVEAVVYVAPASLLCFIDDLLNPVPIPRPINVRAGTQTLKRLLLARICNRAVSKLPLPFNSSSSLIGDIAHTATAPFQLLDMVRRNNNMPTPAKLYNRSGVDCYQNSVLQALSTAAGLEAYLDDGLKETKRSSLGRARLTRHLSDILHKLQSSQGLGHVHRPENDLYLLGRHDQQDAQEYYNSLMDKVMEEIKKMSTRRSRSNSLDPDGKPTNQARSPSQESQDSHDSGYGGSNAPAMHPLRGLLAHRVTCLVCGFSEGLRMEPFFNITVSLFGRAKWRGPGLNIASELDNLFGVDKVDGVTCNKCTLVKWRSVLKSQIVNHKERPNPSDVILGRLQERLDTIVGLIDGDLFDDESLKLTAKVPKKMYVNSSKTKQYCIGRPPRNLVIHLSRNSYGWEKVKDPIDFPQTLDLSPWILGSAKGSPPFIYGDLNNLEEPVTPRQWTEQWNMEATQSMLAGSSRSSSMTGPKYKLSAVVIHKGSGTSSGHFTCWRQENKLDSHKQSPGTWWEISDSRASQHAAKMLSSHQVKQGAFMLFYECVDPLIQHESSPMSLRTSLSSASLSSAVSLPDQDIDSLLPKHIQERRKKKLRRAERRKAAAQANGEKLQPNTEPNGQAQDSKPVPKPPPETAAMNTSSPPSPKRRHSELSAAGDDDAGVVRVAGVTRITNTNTTTTDLPERPAKKPKKGKKSRINMIVDGHDWTGWHAPLSLEHFTRSKDEGSDGPEDFTSRTRANSA